MASLDFLGELSVDNVRSDVEHITTHFPSRLAGSESGRKMAEYSAERMKQNGAGAYVQEFQALVSFPEAGGCVVIEPAASTMPANTLGHSLPTADGGLVGELVDVKSASTQDFAGKDFAGKIVLCGLDDSPMRHEKQRQAALRGAIGAVMINTGPADSKLLPFGSVKPAWGNPSPDIHRDEVPRIPCIGISRFHGNQLRALCASGQRVSVEMKASVVNGWYPIHNTIGEVKSAVSDDFVLIGGHQDAWYGARATDNASANSCMFELARVFARHRGEFRRGFSSRGSISCDGSDTGCQGSGMERKGN